MNSDSNTDIRLAFSAGVEPHRVAVAVAPVSSVVTDSEARSEVDFLSVLRLDKMFGNCVNYDGSKDYRVFNTYYGL